MKKKKIKIVWSCSDHKHHEHKYKFTAYLCGRLQYVFAKLKNGFCVSSVVRRAVERYYGELADIEMEEKNELCVYGEKIKETYRYKKRELQKSLLKIKISFYESFI